MDAATIKFEHAIAFAVLPVSKELAALHASRTRTHSQSFSCSRCGSDLTTSGTRLARSKRSATRPLRVLSTSCHACGEVISIPVSTGNASRFPPCRKSQQVRLAKQDTQTLVPSPSAPVLPAISSPSPVTPPMSCSNPILQPNKTSKKKSGLQQMLQRNREKEQKRSETQASKPPGLSAFLSTL